jgi:hypothetical protein
MKTLLVNTFLVVRTKEAEKIAPSGPTHPWPKFGAAMGLRGHARTGHASSPGPPVIDPCRYVFSNATRPPASVRPIASSQSKCALGAPPSPSMPAAASTPAWRADWAVARWHSLRPLDARPLAPLKGGHNGAVATSLHRHSHRSRQSHHIPATTAQPWGSERRARAGTTTRPAGLDAGLLRAAPGRPRRSASVIAGTFR